MQTPTSFIDAVITDMCEGNGSYNTVANTVQSMDHKDVANRIALAWVKLGNDRQLARRANMEPKVKPEVLLGFVQQVMNQVCWAARRLVFAQQTSEAEDQANGLDFSQDVAGQVGVEGVATDKIGTIVEDDFFILNNLQTWLAAKMEYLEGVDPLYLYADRAPLAALDSNSGSLPPAEPGDYIELAEDDPRIGDEEREAIERAAIEQDAHLGDLWVIVRHADTFNEALAIMDNLAFEFQERNARVAHTEASTIDFATGAIH